MTREFFRDANGVIRPKQPAPEPAVVAATGSPSATVYIRPRPGVSVIVPPDSEGPVVILPPGVEP